MGKRKYEGHIPFVPRTRQRIRSDYITAVRSNQRRRRYQETVARQKRLDRARDQQLSWRLRKLGLAAAGQMQPTPLPAFKRNVRSTKPIYRTPRPRYAAKIRNNVTSQIKRSTPGSSLRMKADRKKFTLNSSYSFQWRPSNSVSSNVADWFDIYPNRLINNVHMASTHATLQLGGPRSGQTDYDKFVNIPGVVPNGYREVSQSYECCIVTGTKITVDFEMPNNTTSSDQEYVMGMYFEKDGQFTPNQFVEGNDTGAHTKKARFASWAAKNSDTFVNFDADYVETDGQNDRNGDTFTFLDFDKLPDNYLDMSTKAKPVTGAPTVLNNYSRTNNPSSRTKCIKRFEFFWNIDTTGKDPSELISDTEPREFFKPDLNGVTRAPASTNQKCAGPYGHMFEKDNEVNYHAQDPIHHHHEMHMFSNDNLYLDDIAVRNGFLEPSRGGIVRFVLFRKSGLDFVRSTMGKLDIKLDFSVLAFNKVEYNTDRKVANMPQIHEQCKSVSNITPIAPTIYYDRRGNQEVEMEDYDELRAENDVIAE